jgi:hypothetical protein
VVPNTDVEAVPKVTEDWAIKVVEPVWVVIPVNEQAYYAVAATVIHLELKDQPLAIAFGAKLQMVTALWKD